jgi:hypothetical protein
MAFLGRIVVVVFAVMVASLAAGVAVAVGLWGPQWHGVSGDVGERFVFWGTAFFASTLTGSLTLLPAAILIALAEAFKLRSLLVHLAAGAAMLALVYAGSGLAPPSYEESIDRPPPPVSREMELAAAAGAVFGFAYWLIAGRNAGRWRERESIKRDL